MNPGLFDCDLETSDVEIVECVMPGLVRGRLGGLIAAQILEVYLSSSDCCTGGVGDKAANATALRKLSVG